MEKFLMNSQKNMKRARGLRVKRHSKVINRISRRVNYVCRRINLLIVEFQPDRVIDGKNVIANVFVHMLCADFELLFASFHALIKYFKSC